MDHSSSRGTAMRRVKCVKCVEQKDRSIACGTARRCILSGEASKRSLAARRRCLSQQPHQSPRTRTALTRRRRLCRANGSVQARRRRLCQADDLSCHAGGGGACLARQANDRSRHGMAAAAPVWRGKRMDHLRSLGTVWSVNFSEDPDDKVSHFQMLLFGCFILLFRRL
jgi:hypothetical protein